ncbi:MAG: FxsA family protein [Solirubrobacteraceae bacterium]
MFALLLLILWPIAELFVAIKVAEAIGVGLTVLALVVSCPLGIWLARAEGRSAWRRLSLAVSVGRPPGRQVVDGALIMLGGVLLVIPGFITDVLGAALLVGPLRSLGSTVLVRNFQSRAVRAATRFSRAPRSAYDVDATATDIDGPRLVP